MVWKLPVVWDEINNTGPVESKMIINALNSSAKVFMFSNLVYVYRDWVRLGTQFFIFC